MERTPDQETARRAALRTAAVACARGAVLQATAAAPLWRALKARELNARGDRRIA
jgi:hypothetical protein